MGTVENKPVSRMEWFAAKCAELCKQSNEKIPGDPCCGYVLEATGEPLWSECKREDDIYCLIDKKSEKICSHSLAINKEN